MTTAEFRALCPDALVLEAIAPGPLMSMNQRTHWATNGDVVGESSKVPGAPGTTARFAACTGPDGVAEHLARCDRAFGPEPTVGHGADPGPPRVTPPPAPLTSNRAPSLMARLRELPGWRP